MHSSNPITADHEGIKNEVCSFLPLRESQISAFTDSMLLRNSSDGACGLASCIYIEWSGGLYALSCHHVLAEERDYIAGAKQLKSQRIAEAGTHEVRPFRLIASDPALDLAVFSIEGLDISSLPKSAYQLSNNRIDLKSASKNLGTVSFIGGVPGLMARGTQYNDGLVFMSLPSYSGYGPITEVTENQVVADFAEKELIELNDKDFPELKDLQPTGGARDLSGMSGSGLWVIDDDHFVLLGILLGPVRDNDPKDEHRIRFTPIWKVISWLKTIELTPNSELSDTGQPVTRLEMDNEAR
jgi:hypothetical protein